MLHTLVVGMGRAGRELHLPSLSKVRAAPVPWTIVPVTGATRPSSWASGRNRLHRRTERGGVTSSPCRPPIPETVRVSYAGLLDFATAVFAGSGVPRARARAAARTLCHGNLTGMRSSGKGRDGSGDGDRDGSGDDGGGKGNGARDGGVDGGRGVRARPPVHQHLRRGAPADRPRVPRRHPASPSRPRPLRLRVLAPAPLRPVPRAALPPPEATGRLSLRPADRPSSGSRPPGGSGRALRPRGAEELPLSD
jgi:hypothetical protein